MVTIISTFPVPSETFTVNQLSSSKTNSHSSVPIPTFSIVKVSELVVKPKSKFSVPSAKESTGAIGFNETE